MAARQSLMATRHDLRPDYPNNALVNELSDTQLQNLTTAVEKCKELVKELSTDQRVNSNAPLEVPKDPLFNPAIHPDRWEPEVITDEVLEIVAKHLPAFMGRDVVREEHFDRVYTSEDLASFYRLVCFGSPPDKDSRMKDRPPLVYGDRREKTPLCAIGKLTRDCLPRPKKDKDGNSIEIPAKTQRSRRKGCYVFVRLSFGNVTTLPSLKPIDVTGKLVPADAVAYLDPNTVRVDLKRMQDRWNEEEKRDAKRYNLEKMIQIVRAEIYMRLHQSEPSRTKEYKGSANRPISVEPAEYLPTLRHRVIVSELRIPMGRN